MTPIEPDELLPGRVLVLAPHMDDELLGCGATLAGLTRRSHVFVAFATDGALSPVPPDGSGEPVCADLPALRAAEAREAMAMLGVPLANLRFLSLPDGRLADEPPRLEAALRGLVDDVRPDQLLVPFRFDRHPDHLALNRAVRKLAGERGGPEVVEYFVYARTRLLPRGDLRAYLRGEHKVAVEAGHAADRKRRALECYRTQVTRYFAWQHRPILTPALLDENCRSPEIFLRAAGVLTDAEVFDAPLWVIRAAHAVEPHLKRWKDDAVARLARPERGRSRTAA
jgi:LmbE family N-acetylglucosaminyl deacetylase